MPTKLKTYQVMVHVNLDTVVEVKAESLEDAIARGREFKMKDVVDFDTDWVDGDITVNGVYE